MRGYCVQFHAYYFKNTNKKTILTYNMNYQNPDKQKQTH